MLLHWAECFVNRLLGYYTRFLAWLHTATIRVREADVLGVKQPEQSGKGQTVSNGHGRGLGESKIHPRKEENGLNSVERGADIVVLQHLFTITA